jgi:hypothetical protein
LAYLKRKKLDGGDFVDVGSVQGSYFPDCIDHGEVVVATDIEYADNAEDGSFVDVLLSIQLFIVLGHCDLSAAPTDYQILNAFLDEVFASYLRTKVLEYESESKRPMVDLQ